MAADSGSEPGLSLRTAIADCLDRRRNALTETVRVVAAHKDTVLHQRACAMAIPMIYAHWEGFAKEVLQLYVEFLEKCAVAQREVHSNLLAYSWSGSFRKLQGTLTHDKKVELIERFLGSLTEALAFEKREREIDTKSNLLFEVLEDLARFLCLDIAPMRGQSKKLDALVSRRNNIAHGGREQKIEDADIEEYRTLVLSLMEALEKVLDAAVQSSTYRRTTTTVAMVSAEAGAAVVEILSETTTPSGGSS